MPVKIGRSGSIKYSTFSIDMNSFDWCTFYAPSKQQQHSKTQYFCAVTQHSRIPETVSLK